MEINDHFFLLAKFSKFLWTDRGSGMKGQLILVLWLLWFTATILKGREGKGRKDLC